MFTIERLIFGPWTYWRGLRMHACGRRGVFLKHLPVLFGYHASDLGNSHVPLSLCRSWHSSGRAVSLVVPSAEKGFSYPWLKPSMTGLKKKLIYRLRLKDQPRKMTESDFFTAERSSPVVYLWAGLSLDVFEKFHELGTKIVLERINCHNATARRLIQTAQGRWATKTDSEIGDDHIESENKKLAMADAVFCPSPMVESSMLENQVPQSKLLLTSYGWEPKRFPRISEARQPNPKPVFLFVGKLCLRKGVPLLLDAWQHANVDGQLVLCGAVDPEFLVQFGHKLGRENIVHLAYTKNIGDVFRKADVFVFPSHEEGGPMVTYEAMAHGIAPLVSPMGAGAIVQNERNGMILPDMDVDAWAAAIREIAVNTEKRRELGENARLRAQEFTWDKVAQRRAELLEHRYPALWSRREQG
jgi:glycosyltransferase involved in cell wall biosynthesis